MSLPRHLPPVAPEPQMLSLFEQPDRIPLAVRRQAEFFVFFASTIFPLLETYRERLAPLYCADNGRPAWDPVRLLGVLVLQFVLRVTDRQAAETVQEQPRQAGEPTANFLTAIVTQNAPASDKAGMAEVSDEQQAMGLDAPSALYVDGAYVSSEALKDASEQGRELRGPAPASPDRGKVFTVEKFDVHVEERYAVCPAAQRSSNCSRLEEQSTGKVVYRFEWSNAVCGACPLRAQCVSAGQDHRTFVVGELHSLLQERRREMQTDAFKKEMHQRSGIEGTQSERVRGYGLRQARYRGKDKVRLQNYLIGAACNIRRLFRRLAWEAKQARRAASPAMVPVTA